MKDNLIIIGLAMLLTIPFRCPAVVAVMMVMMIEESVKKESQ